MPEAVTVCSQKFRPRLGPDPTLFFCFAGFFFVDTIYVKTISKGRWLKVCGPQMTHLNSLTIFRCCVLLF